MSLITGISIISLIDYSSLTKRMAKETNYISYDEATGILCGRYNEHLDILVVHRKIIGILEWREEEGITSLASLAQHGLKMLSGDQDVSFDDCSRMLDKGFGTIVGMSGKREYEIRARAHLKRFAQLSKLSKDDTSARDRLAYIEAYFNLVRNFLKTNISYSGLHNSHGGNEECENCGAELIEDADTCLKCGLLVSKALEPAAYIDIKSSSSSSIPRGTNDDPSGDGTDVSSSPDTSARKKKAKGDLYIKFQELYSRWKGTSGVKIDPHDLQIIKSYLNINHDDLTIDAKCWHLNAEILIKALKKTQNSKYIPDLNIVARELWDRPIPNVVMKQGRDFEAKLEEQWHKAQKVIAGFGTKEATKLAANGWRLWHELSQAGYECERKEFDMPMSEVTLENWEKIWDAVCTEHDWTNPYRS